MRREREDCLGQNDLGRLQPGVSKVCIRRKGKREGRAAEIGIGLRGMSKCRSILGEAAFLQLLKATALS